MQNRIYEFVTGIETAVQPDSGTPTLANDIVTKSYVDGILGTDKQEQCGGVSNGSNVTFTVTQTPLSAASFRLYLNGVYQRLTTHYTRSGTTITMVVAPEASQELDAVYKY